MMTNGYELVDTTIRYVDTGWRCSVCYELAQVLCAGETMCVEHARRWNHGYGESIEKLKEKSHNDRLPNSN